MAPTESEKLLATLDPHLRREFDAWTQQQLVAQLAANPTDPYAATRAMLDHEEQQADAGFVPPADPAQQGWYIVPPTEDPRPAVIRPRRRLRLPGSEQQRMVVALVLVVLLFGGAIDATWPRKQRVAAQTRPPAAAAATADVPFPARD